MKWFSNWLGARARAKPNPRPRIVPLLEALEKREVLTVTYNGGALLHHVDLQAVYYGSNWSANPALYQQTGQFEGYLNYLVTSPYMDMLTKAGYDVGQGSFHAGNILDYQLSSSQFLQDGTIQNNLRAEINAGALLPNDANRLYVVYVEPNIAVNDPGQGNSITNFAGYHGSFTGSDGSVVRYAVVTTPGGATVGGAPNAANNYSLSPFNEMTEASSHEIAEAVTDPNINYNGPNVNYPTIGWYDYQNNGEIGDITNGQTVQLNGYTVQVMPDQNDNPIVPTELSLTGLNVSAFAGDAFSGNVAEGNDSTGLTQISNLFSTINWGDGVTTIGSVSSDGHGGFFVGGAHTYATGGNFVVTVQVKDLTNSISSIGEATTQTVLNAPPSYTVGEYAGQGVWLHSSQTGWQHLTNSNATAVSVNSLGDVVAEFQGHGVWRYTSATGWHQLGTGNASQLVITSNDGYDVVAAEYQGQGVWRYTDEDGAGWQHIASADASSLAAAGNFVVAQLGGNGVWRYDANDGWKQLTPSNATQVAVDVNGDVAGEFQGYGVWRYEDGAGWKQLTTSDATQISIAGSGIVAGEFQGSGVYRYEDFTGWQLITNTDAAQVAVDAQGDVAGEIQGQGLWFYADSGADQHLSAVDALFISLSA